MMGGRLLYTDEETRRIPGVPFDFTIPSNSDPERSYRVVRDDEGLVIHPRCPAFRHRGTCRHLTRALQLAEHPYETFVRDLLELGPAVVTPEVYAAAEAAREQAMANTRHRQRVRRRAAEQARLDAMPPDERRAEAERDLATL